MYATIGVRKSLADIRLHRDDDGRLVVWVSVGYEVNLAFELAELPQLMVALDEAREQGELVDPAETKVGTLWTAKLMAVVAPDAKAS